jgi:uncharacterized protein
MIAPSRPWATVELLLAVAIMYAGLTGYLPLAATPYLLVVGAIFLWWRGPGWRAIGLRRPESWTRTLLVALAVGAYQLPSLYLVEPAIARLTSGELPDVSVFRSLVGDERQLLLWLAISWTFAAFMEEMVYRGWLIARVAELARFTQSGWIAGVIVTSIVFGLAHLYQGTSGVIATGLTGLIFGVAYLASGRNLWCAILAHGVMDTIGFVMIYLGVYPGV